MKTNRVARSLITSISLLFVGGCAIQDTQQAERLVSPLPKLTSAIVAEIRYLDPDSPVPDDRLVTDALKDKPELQRAFAGYPLKVLHDTKNAVVLVCSPDGKWAWLEDASWTLGVDHEWYLSKPPLPAAFTMAPAQAKTSGLKRIDPIYHAN
jgi:hypothetical protein